MSILIAAGSIFEAETICCDYCDSVGPCVIVTEPTCCYTGGEEAGVIVGLIDSALPVDRGGHLGPSGTVRHSPS